MENYREKRLERQLKSQQSTSIVIAVILLLSILGNVFLFVRNSTMNNQNEELDRQLAAMTTEKEAVEQANAQLKADINDLNNQINEVRESAAALEAEINTRDSRIAGLRNQVAEIDQLRQQVAELEALREEFTRLEEERQQLMAELQQLNEKLAEMETRHQALLARAEEATYLKAYNVCVFNLRDRWLGRPVTMELARRVNRTTVSFEINGNILVEPGQKEIHLVMTDPAGNVINGTQETFMISGSGNTSQYTKFRTIEYNRQSVPLSYTIVHEDRLDSGTFRMEVYIDGVLSGGKEFSLE